MCTPSINHCPSGMHLCGCAINLFQIPRIPFNPRFIPFPCLFFFFSWPERIPNQVLYILDSADSSLNILASNPELCTILHHHLSKCQTWSSDLMTQPGLKPLQLYPEVYLRSSLPSELEEII